MIGMTPIDVWVIGVEVTGLIGVEMTGVTGV